MKFFHEKSQKFFEKSRGKFVFICLLVYCFAIYLRGFLIFA